MTTKNTLTILLYHGVTDSASNGIENFSGKHIEANEFRRQMTWVKNRCTLLSMDDVVELTLTKKTFPHQSVAVTFDDGFRNNFTVAAPILDELRVPATFYLCAGMLDTQRMFFTDVIEDCVNLSKSKKIAIALDGNSQVFPLADNGDKIKAVNTIKGYCKRVGPDERTRTLNDVEQITRVIPSVEHAVNYEKLYWNDVQDMDRNDLFTIGGHSLYHDILSTLPHEKIEVDIRTTLGLLAFNLNHVIEHFSYPEGQEEHYNAAVIDSLQHNGIICCPSAIHGTNTFGQDLFHLRRIMVGFNGTPFPFDEGMV